MPSPDASNNEPTPAKPEKSSTPRRASAVKRTLNGTPRRKASAQKASTPHSAPARGGSKTKKVEPTLLGDFLLGRPSPARTRRKSLEAVKAEMKVGAVSKIQSPGGVKDRVKQWQKASAAAAVVDATEARSEPDEVLVHVDEESVGEEDRMRIKHRKARTKPVKVREREQPSDQERGAADDVVVSSTPDREKIAPKKRVVSDDHWMQKKNRKTPPKKKSPIIVNIMTGAVQLPDDLTPKNSAVPPLTRKIEEWARQMSLEDAAQKEGRPSLEVEQSAKGKSAKAEDPIHVVPEDDGIRIIPSRTQSDADEGVPIKPSKADRYDDRYRLRTMREDPPSKETSAKAVEIDPANDGIRVAASKEGSRRRRGKEDLDEGSSRQQREDARLRSSAERPSPRKTSTISRGAESGLEEMTTPTRGMTKSRHRKSDSPSDSLADIPVGYSAFSVLDMPVGADADSMRPQRPLRNPSFKAVPKVLKKVYNEGKKMVHDTVDPPRLGINQPPSIESWLNGTSDPFLDQPSTSTANKESTKPRQTDDQSTITSDSQNVHHIPDDGRHSGRRQHRHARSSTYPENDGLLLEEENEPQPDIRNSNGQEPREIGHSSSSLKSPGLKRSPAVRTASSPIRSAKKTPLREKVAEAFRGESTTKPQINPTPTDAYDEHHTEKAALKPEVTSRSLSRDLDPVKDDVSRSGPLKRSRRMPDIPNFEKPQGKVISRNNPLNQRNAPMTGHHRLSTIASVETFKSSNPKSETSSLLSETTVTQTTLSSYLGTSYTGSSYTGTSHTGPTETSISHKSSKPSSSKRRLTKHSDLLSVLSLPDAVGPNRSKSIRSACSVRTTRTHLATATASDLLRELADDEVKYMRELRTLVDGVIPVLLTCVLSKSESAKAAGLFHPLSSQDSDTAITKPIVDMGIALERLKSLHKRIPLQDQDQLMRWAIQARKVYEDYLTAWRMGFQDVVVNLASASRSVSAEEQPLRDGLPWNAEGDVTNGDGERVDVAFLLKRPLIRIKHLNRLIKGMNMLFPSEHTKRLSDQYQDLLVKTRRRTKEEEARLENLAANHTDASRARDPRTLAPMEGVSIDHSREVYAKDYFNLQLQHSSGQRIDCRVELLLRDKPKDSTDPGDLLLCEVNTISRWLFLPPIERNYISARAGDLKEELVVLIRGVRGSKGWQELFMLTADNDEIAADWIQMLGSSPVPPPFESISLNPEQGLPPIPSRDSRSKEQRTPSSPSAVEIPLGERRSQENDSSLTSPSNPQTPYGPGHHRTSSATMDDHVADDTKRTSAMSAIYEMSGALSDEDVKRSKPKRYHSRQASEPIKSSVFGCDPTSTLLSTDHATEEKPGYPRASDGDRSPTLPLTMKMPFVEKRRQPLERKTFGVSQKVISSDDRRSDTQSTGARSESVSNVQPHVRADGAPIPPAHKTANLPTLKKIPILESFTSRFKNRRSSSPLKHEYHLSDGSDTSSEASDSEDSRVSCSDSSDDEELEGLDVQMPLPDLDGLGKKISPAASLSGTPGASLAPSNSASQAAYRGSPTQPHRLHGQVTKLVASVFYWAAPRWESFHPDVCSIVIGPGLIEAYAMSASHSSPGKCNEAITSSDPSDLHVNSEAGAEDPLIAMDLTPLVSTRCSSALDVEIKSPLLERSILKYKGPVTPIRFRARTPEECQKLYAVIWRARLNNAIFIALEQERMINSYGTHSYEAAVRSSRIRSWFGRQRSYRASARAPSISASDNNSSGTFTSAVSALRRLSTGGSFNIAKSSVGTTQGMVVPSGSASLYSSSESGTSGRTPPHTSISGSVSTSVNMQKIISRGSQNLKIRCYKLETQSSWLHLGSCRLTIDAPPPGMRQASSLYNGTQKRVTVTAKSNESKGDKDGEDKEQSKRLSRTNRRMSLTGMLGQKHQAEDEDQVDDESTYHILLDVVIGSHCFQRYQKTGIAINVWEEIMGPNGEVGVIRNTGGVSTGKTSKWMFQFGTAEETAWIYALCGGR
ncbi:MAG: hypothetical protein M1818_004693 [Claussenomyces sp. TS43310]|nr:MAG: hypothetical protein M1818_004693 [Claussenomyces sp. TS43310]